MSKWRRSRKITGIPIYLGIIFSWEDYDFSLCGSEEYFHKGKKEGKHIFTISCGIFYWSILLTFYSPTTID